MGVLRLLLALSVVALHSGAILGCSLVGGQVAVQAFFIISGFYMSLIINEKYANKTNSYRLFITSRLLRLYPMYWVVLLATVVVCLAVAVATKGQYTPKFDSYLAVKASFFPFAYLLLSNVLLFGQDVVMFLGIVPASGHLYFTHDFHQTKLPLLSFLFVTQAWTLGLELTFYLVAPFVLKNGLRLVLLLIGLSALLRLFIYNYLGWQHDPWTYRFFPTEILFFLLGYLSYRLYNGIRNGPVSAAQNALLLGYIFGFTVFYPALAAGKVRYLPFSLKELLYFASVVVALPYLFKLLKNSRLDTHIGNLSYPVYISHMLVIMVCSKLPFVPLQASWVIALITLGIAYLLDRLVATPLEKYRQARVQNAAPLGAGGARPPSPLPPAPQGVAVPLAGAAR